MQKKGIDVSRHNGTINWEKVKATGIDFVLLRAGYGKHASQKDVKFEEYYSECKRLGIEVGCYWYSYATTAEEAKQEALACYECIKDKKFEYPVYFDYEDKCIRPTKYTKENIEKYSKMAREIIPAFISVLENKGYFVGLYSFKSLFQTLIPDEFKQRYTIWLAHLLDEKPYTVNESTRGVSSYKPYDAWQYTWYGKVNGIPSEVDMDMCYRDFPSIIKTNGFNGYKKNSSSSSNTNQVIKPADNTITKTDNNTKKYTSGQKITLSNTKLYASSTAKSAVTTKSGTYYIYSSSIENGRIRITNSSKNVGKTPINNYVTGWIDAN